ncbi:MAG TPA: roadblock/LC7 domain-containing protein [Candidatus Methanoperedens sp.]|nr:roadblock/LC7 domain-containing protein [Candidatus Methanoperedens sp.]
MKEHKMSDVYNSILLDMKKLKGVKRIALAGRDGYLIGEHASEGSETLTLMSANMLQAAENITNTLEKVNPNRVIVDYKGGKLITTSVGSKALISVMTEKDASIDSIIKELDKTAGRIKEIL